MRVLLQRVTQGSVTIESETVGKIDAGLVLLVGIGQEDTTPILEKMADKIVGLRIFNDEQGKFNRSLLDVTGSVLVVSQFTLFADCRKGRRPSFTDAGKPDHASPLCDAFVDCLKARGVSRVETGQFGASMKVDLCNDGPVTIWLDSDELGMS